MHPPHMADLTANESAEPTKRPPLRKQIISEPARPRSTAAVAGPNAHRVPINKKPVVAPRKAVRKFMKMPPAKKAAAAVGAAVGAAAVIAL